MHGRLGWIDRIRPLVARMPHIPPPSLPVMYMMRVHVAQRHCACDLPPCQREMTRGDACIGNLAGCHPGSWRAGVAAGVVRGPAQLVQPGGLVCLVLPQCSWRAGFAAVHDCTRCAHGESARMWRANNFAAADQSCGCGLWRSEEFHACHVVVAVERPLLGAV